MSNRFGGEIGLDYYNNIEQIRKFLMP